MSMERGNNIFRSFRLTELYQDIKLNCGLPPTSILPNYNWSLSRGLLKREYGLASYHHNGNFSLGQQRSVVGSYLPNRWSKMLMAYNFQTFPYVEIITCRFDASGEKLLVASTEGIHLFDAKNGAYKYLKSMDMGSSRFWITGADISSCGEMIATYVAKSGKIILNRIDDSNIRNRIKLHKPNDIYDVDIQNPLYFMPCGKKVIGNFEPYLLVVVDIERELVQERLSFQPRYCMFYSYTAKVLDKINPNVIACAHSYSRSLRIYDLRCSPRYVKRFLNYGITSIDSHNNGNYLLTNSKDESVRICDIRSPATSRIYRIRNNYVMRFQGHSMDSIRHQARFSPFELTGQRYIYTGSRSGNIYIYDLLTGQTKVTCAVENPETNFTINTVECHPQRNEIISSTNCMVNLCVYKEDDRTTTKTCSEESLENKSNEKDETFWSNLKSIG